MILFDAGSVYLSASYYTQKVSYPSSSLQNLAFGSSAIIRAQIIPFLFSPFHSSSHLTEAIPSYPYHPTVRSQQRSPTSQAQPALKFSSSQRTTPLPLLLSPSLSTAPSILGYSRVSHRSDFQSLQHPRRGDTRPDRGTVRRVGFGRRRDGRVARLERWSCYD